MSNPNSVINKFKVLETKQSEVLGMLGRPKNWTKVGLYNKSKTKIKNIKLR